MYKRIEFFELANRNKNYDENSNGEGHLCLLYLVFISAFFLFLRKHPLQTATATPATVGKKKKTFQTTMGREKCTLYHAYYGNMGGQLSKRGIQN